MATRRVTFRLYPNKKQEQTLRYHRKLHKDLYNAAVCNRLTQYQRFNHRVDYFEQQNSLPAFKEVWTEYQECNCMTLQATLKRVDYAFNRWLKGLDKSILDVGMGMLRSAIEYKVKDAGGVFVEVPTRQVKPSQTCPNCGNQQKKTLDERVHHCHKCGFTMDRDLAAALVMLLWALGKLPGFGTRMVDANVSSSTSETCKRKRTGSMKQLGQMKRQKHSPTGLVVETRDLNEVGLGSSFFPQTY